MRVQYPLQLRRLVLVLAVLPAFAADLGPRPNFSSAAAGGLKIVSPCLPLRPWTVAGERGALLGRQTGRFEAWQWPVKILSDFRISAELADYAVPIDVNALAARIEVTPAETTITYSHAAFTIRQHMFATRGGQTPPAAGAAVFFEIDSLRPLELTFSFTPDMLRMWPAPNSGRPNGEWVLKQGAGVYVLHTDDPKFSAVVAMPRTHPGIMPPYQERPQTYPLQLKLSYDPKRDGGLVFPLSISLLGDESPLEKAASINAAMPALYEQTQGYYAHFFDHRVVVNTPDKRLDEALRWAEVAVDQAKVRAGDELGLIAGYYESADSARPGYAWFFGRDTLWSTYAINSYGDFELTRNALDFLLRRQRTDGKIMHEYSQSAGSLDWKTTPYFYASADSTPLMVMAMWDYVKNSGDIDYLKANWPAVRRAYGFTRAHETNDGIYSNAEGTAWVESWPPTMPQEEIYLAAVDQQSAAAMSRLAAAVGDGVLATSAGKKAAEIAGKIEAEYYEPEKNFYAFSRNRDNSLDSTATIYPAVAWWDGTLALKSAGPMLSRWASHEFSTDWGTRDVSDQTPFYDPISYHQGTVWPLFTGWASLAEYRAGRPLAGYAHLMQNANLTWAQDLGSVTELLSGDLFQPLGRSSSHQLWSSAMVVTPLLRGLFGLDADAPSHTLRVAPKLPAAWESAEIQHVKVGMLEVDLKLVREGASLRVRARTGGAEVLCLTANPLSEKVCTAAPTTERSIIIALPAVELGIPAELPEAGARTRQLKVANEESGKGRSVFVLEAQGGSQYDLTVRPNRTNIKVDGAELQGTNLHVAFPPGLGYQSRTITFTW